MKALKALGPDIAVLSEATEETIASLEPDASSVWIGPGRGLAVIGFNGWQIERAGPIVTQQLFLPVRISRDAQEHHLIGACVRKDGSYIRPTLDALVAMTGFVRETAPILAGDFNQSALFDIKRKPALPFSTVVARLAGFGMRSAWHDFQREEFGNENEQTYFHQWKQVQGFHIDYAFIPERYKIRSAALGSFEDYVATKLSDHVPLTVELDYP